MKQRISTLWLFAMAMGGAGMLGTAFGCAANRPSAARPQAPRAPVTRTAPPRAGSAGPAGTSARQAVEGRFAVVNAGRGDLSTGRALLGIYAWLQSSKKHATRPAPRRRPSATPAGPVTARPEPPRRPAARPAGSVGRFPRAISARALRRALAGLPADPSLSVALSALERGRRLFAALDRKGAAEAFGQAADVLDRQVVWRRARPALIQALTYLLLCQDALGAAAEATRTKARLRRLAGGGRPAGVPPAVWARIADPAPPSVAPLPRRVRLVLPKGARVWFDDQPVQLGGKPEGSGAGTAQAAPKGPAGARRAPSAASVPPAAGDPGAHGPAAPLRQGQGGRSDSRGSRAGAPRHSAPAPRDGAPASRDGAPVPRDSAPSGALMARPVSGSAGTWELDTDATGHLLRVEKSGHRVFVREIPPGTQTVTVRVTLVPEVEDAYADVRALLGQLRKAGNPWAPAVFARLARLAGADYLLVVLPQPGAPGRARWFSARLGRFLAKDVRLRLPLHATEAAAVRGALWSALVATRDAEAQDAVLAQRAREGQRKARKTHGTTKLWKKWYFWVAAAVVAGVVAAFAIKDSVQKDTVTLQVTRP